MYRLASLSAARGVFVWGRVRSTDFFADFTQTGFSSRLVRLNRRFRRDAGVVLLGRYLQASSPPLILFK